MKHQDLIHGLLQLNPAGGHFTHHPVHGWPINTPPITNKELHIWFEDDLTVYQNKVVEIEKYIEHYGHNISKITFYTDHKFLQKLYPKLKFVWYPKWLKVHCINASVHQEKLKNIFKFDHKTKKFLCLNRNIRAHRDRVCRYVQKNLSDNAVWTYTKRGIKSPVVDDWSDQDYFNSPMWGSVDLDDSDNTNNHTQMLRNLFNIIKAKDMYNQTGFSLVTETRANLPFDFVTEKTMQCFITLHPALFVSNRWHVKMIKEWGFDLFDDIFDHSYDEEKDNDTRITKLFEKNEQVLKNGIVFNNDVKDRLIKNRDHYLNKLIDILPA